MALETATYISDLNALNPVGASDRAIQLDDHIRLIKSTLKATFPNITGAVTSSHTELNIIDGVTATTAELNKLDGVTATPTEFNYLGSVTSAIQTQIGTKRDMLYQGSSRSLVEPPFTSLSTNVWSICRGSTSSVNFNFTDGVENYKARITNAKTSGDITLTASGGGDIYVNGTNVGTTITIGAGETVELIYIDSTTKWAYFHSPAYNA